MSYEPPTLKIRLAVDTQLGMDCNVAATRILDGMPGGPVVTLLDSKWGREPTRWKEDGGGWGRPRLTPFERGFVEGVSSVTPTGSTERLLLDIIERLTSSRG